MAAERQDEVRTTIPPLHVKSAWSLGVGAATVEELVARAVRDGHGAVALTDLETLAGQVELHARAAAAGLRAITGVELRPGAASREPGDRRGRVVLLARDRAGYETLCRVVSRRRGARGAGAPPGRVGGAEAPPGPVDGEDHAGEDPLGSLEACAPAGVFALSDDPAVLPRLVELVGRADAGALVVRPAPVHDEAAVLAAARALDLPLVASPDALFLDPPDHDLHRLLAAIRAGVRVDRARVEPRERHLPASLEATFADLPAALLGARRVAGACALELHRAPPVLPALDLQGEAPDAHLARRCAARLAAARGAGRLAGEAYDARLARELAALATARLAPYVLVVAELVGAARARGIEVAGRGSAAASLVAHLLGITQVDPVALGLTFERFLHERRVDLPDIDVDLPSDRRDELLAWAFERFGPDRVAMVAAHQTFRRRAALREGLKALGAPAEDVDRFVKKLPPDDLPVPEGPWVPAWLVPARHRALAPLVERLVGKPRHLSVHPGGLAIADRPIEAYTPLERAPGGVVVAQYDLLSIERVGLVKLDLLGSRTLTELQRALDLLRRRRPAAGPARALAEGGLAAIPDDDPATLAALDRADTIGVASLESPAVRSLLARLPIRALGDVMAALALVRPGAGAGEAKELFVRRARGEAPIPALDPLLAGPLAATHGVLLYEEQVIEVLARVTGASLGEADLLRAAIVRAGEDAPALAALEAEVVARAGRFGVAAPDARRVWAAVARFAAYSFNAAHAASQARLAYLAAFVRTHAPVELGCAALDHHGGAYPLRAIAADLARRGVRLRPPCVNRSGPWCEPEEGAIRLGLDRVRRVADPTLARLLEARQADGPFADVRDLLRRVRPSRRELEALVRAGACDALPPLSPDPLARDALLAALGDGPTAPDRVPATLPAPRPRTAGDEALLARWRALCRARDELTFLEVAVSGHPMGVLRDEARAHGCATLAEAAARPGERVSVAAILSAARRVATQHGQVMQFLTLDDETGVLEAVLFPPVQATAGAQVTTPGPFLLEGRMAADADDPHLIVARLRPFHERERPYARLRT